MFKKAAPFASIFLISSIIFTILIYNASAAGEIEIIGPKVRAGTGARPKCGNTLTSCGESGKCMDLTGLVYCERGRVVETYCSSNNIRNRTLTTSCDGGSFRIRIEGTDGNDEEAEVDVYDKDDDKIIGRSVVSGDGRLNSLDLEGDLDFDFRNSEFRFLIKDVDLRDLGESSDFVIDNITPSIPGAIVYKALYVELPQNFTFSTIILKISYANITAEEANITLYKCSDFDISDGTCNTDWQIIPIVRDSANKIVIAEVNSFSVYALGDSGYTTTTTTTTLAPATTTTTTTLPPPTTTTLQSSSSSGGGSGTSGTTTTTTNSTSTSSTSTTTSTNQTTQSTQTTEATQTSQTNESASNANVSSEINQNEDSGSTGAESSTGFFSMVANYMPIALPIAAMTGTLIFNFLKKSKESKGYTSYSKYQRAYRRNQLRGQLCGQLRGGKPNKTNTKYLGKNKKSTIILNI